MSARTAKRVSKQKGGEPTSEPAPMQPPCISALYDHSDFISLQSAAGNRAVDMLLHQSAPRTADATSSNTPLDESALMSTTGEPLDPHTRASMEAHFGEDFRGVRIHADPAADQSARSLNAAAYTVRSHIAFASGQYAPNTAKGRGLLAHELTHVLQQQSGGEGVQLAARGKEPPPLDLDDPATRGRVFQPMAVADVKRLYQQKGYRVYENREWKGWLSRAFKTGAGGTLVEADWGPDMVAIHDRAQKVVAIDITASHTTTADIKPGERRPLPEGEPQQKLHLEKTIEDALQVGRNLPRNLRAYTVSAIDWYREDPGQRHSREIVVWQQGKPIVAGAMGSRGPAHPVGATSASTIEAPVSPETAARSNPKVTTEQAGAARIDPAASRSEKEAPAPERPPTRAIPARSPEAGRSRGLVASKQSIEPFTQTSEPYSRPTSQTPGGGAAALAGGGQLLVDVQQALEREAAFRDSRRSGSVRTFLWWLQRGIEPDARGVTDRWNPIFHIVPYEIEDEYTTGASEILNGLSEGQFDGIEIDPVNSAQYAAFASWASANINDWDDFYRHFVSSEDAGVRWVDGEWKVTTWKWGDWPPANVYRKLVDDKRIAAVMEPIRQQVLAQAATEIEARGQRPDVFAQRGEGRIVGRRRFREGRDTLYSPWTQTAVFFWNQWSFDPLFYEMEGGDPPKGYVFVSGANVRTQITVHDLRAYYGGRRGPGDVAIESSERPRISETKPFTGWGPFRIPVILVRKDSLIEA